MGTYLRSYISCLFMKNNAFTKVIHNSKNKNDHKYEHKKCFVVQM